MYRIQLILYGSAQAREVAKGLLTNLEEVKREESVREPWSIRLALYKPLKESSLIPLLRQSGIQGFRLLET